MKYLMTIAVAAACALTASATGTAQDMRVRLGSNAVRIGTANQRDIYGSDSYGRRLHRYQNNYGYRNGSYGQHHHPAQYRYDNYDYYGGNYGRVRGYRDYYRSNQNRGYNNGYYSRPGFYIGGGSSRVFVGF